MKLFLLTLLIPAGPLTISPEARDLIVHHETGGKRYYESRLQRPSWPGGASGVTVGIGYDIGYNTRAEIMRDWANLPEPQRNALASMAGVKGTAAKIRVSALKWIIVPWGDAERVFVGNTMPRFGGMTAGAFPGVTATHGHVQGAMLSLVFNRGASLSGNSRSEMRNIAAYIRVGRIKSVPPEIRSMKRLWLNRGLDGLLIRREDEVRLIEKSFAP